MTRKRRRKNSSTGNDFLKLILAIGIIALLVFYAKGKWNRPANLSSRPEIIPKVENKSPQAESAPETSSFQKNKDLSKLFPSQAWLDDYLVLKTPLGKSDSQLYLVGIGLAAPGKNPDQTQEVSKLKPYLLVAKKEGDDFVKITGFDFQTPQASIGGALWKNLRGIPRIKSADILDLNGDGLPEIRVSLDTNSDLVEAIGFLKWNGMEFDWLKIKTKQGPEKIALWLAGSSSAESEQIEIKNDKNGYEIIQKSGQADPHHPEKGFEWKSTTWKMKEGVLQNIP